MVGMSMYDIQMNNKFVHHRPILIEYGLWDQVRVDDGKEWVLMLFVQEQLAHLRRNTARPPHLQTTSKQVQLYEQKYSV